MIFFSAAAAIIPMLVYLFIIWKFDRYDREPIGLVLLNYFWGSFGAVILTLLFSGILLKILSYLFNEFYFSDFYQIIILAPVVEEIMKGLFLLITVQNKKFDNLTDGIVYGAAIGLGFGMTENFIYFLQNSQTIQTWVYLVIVRTLFSAVMHCVATGTFGAFLGYAKFKRGVKKILIALPGLLTAILIHVSWNTFVSFKSTTWLGILFMILSVIIFMISFSMSLAKERKIIFAELLEESQTGLIPAAHLSIINSPVRNKSGWIDDNIRKSYVSTAIKLAFRKMQFKNSIGINKEYYEAEIQNLRSTIQKLLWKT